MSPHDQHLVEQLAGLRSLSAACLLGILWWIESIAPLFPGRGRRLSHNAANLGIALLNSVIAAGGTLAVLGATELAARTDFGLVRQVELPTWSQWMLGLLLLDCWQYWWHRLNHRVSFLWRFHAMHHADAELDASSGVRFHPVEMGLSFGARLVVLPLIGLTLPQVLLYEAIALPIVLFHHANIRTPERFDRILRLLVVTPRMHVVHHSMHQPETDSNYSSVLSIWDRLFGSLLLRPHPERIRLGLPDWRERDWRRLPTMISRPFRNRPESRPDAE